MSSARSRTSFSRSASTTSAGAFSTKPSLASLPSARAISCSSFSRRSAFRRAASSGSEKYRARMDEHRRGLILEALERTGGNRSQAARDLGMSRQALLYLIRELNVVPRPRGD